MIVDKTRLSFLAILLAVWLARILPWWESIPAPVRILIAFAYFFLPAVLTLQRAKRALGLSPLETFLHGVSLTVAAFALLFMLTMAFGLTIRWVHHVVPLWALAVTLPLPRYFGGRGNPGGAARSGAVPPTATEQGGMSRVVAIALAFVIGTVVLFSSIAGPSFLPSKDTLDHVGYIEEIETSGRPFPATAVYEDAGKDGLDPRKSLFHPLLASMMGFAGVTGVEFWRTLPGPYSLFLLLCVFYLGRRLTRSHPLALATVVLYVFVQGHGPWGEPFRELANPHHLCMSFFYLAVPSIMLFLQKGARRHLIGSLFYVFLLPTVHVYYLFQVAALVAALLPWVLMARERRSFRLRRYLELGLLSFAVSIPFLLVLRGIYAPANPIQLQIQGIMILGKGLWTADPSLFTGQYGLVGLWSLPVSLILVPSALRSWRASYLLAAIWIPFLVVLNPWLLPRLQGLFGYLPYRLIWLVPTAFLIPYLWKLLPPFPAARSARSLVRLTVWTVYLLLIGVAIARPVRGLGAWRRVLAQEKLLTPYAWKDVLDFLNEQRPEPRIVLADPITSYSIPAYTPHRVVCTLDQHSSPNDALALERIIRARSLFSPMSTPEELRSLVQRTSAQYVIVNRSVPPENLSDYWSLDQEGAELAEELLTRPGSPFRRVYVSPSASLFEIAGEETSEEEDTWVGEGLAEELGLDRNEIPPAAKRDDVRFDIGRVFGDVWTRPNEDVKPVEIVLVSHELERIEKRGDGGPRTTAVKVTTYWTLSALAPSPGKYVVYYRFNTDYPKGRLFRPSVSKVYRKALERRHGVLYRFRSQGLLGGGLLSPDQWSPGTIVREEHTIPVPTSAAPGTYRLSIKLVKEAHVANYLWSDFLRDDDRLQGPAVDTLDLP